MATAYTFDFTGTIYPPKCVDATQNTYTLISTQPHCVCVRIERKSIVRVAIHEYA